MTLSAALGWCGDESTRHLPQSLEFSEGLKGSPYCYYCLQNERTSYSEEHRIVRKKKMLKRLKGHAETIISEGLISLRYNQGRFNAYSNK